MFGHQIPCAKVVIGFDGKVNIVRCHVCTHMKGREKLLIPKFNSLQNDVNRCKCKVARSNYNMFNNIMYMSTWNHNTQTMNFSTCRERDTMVDMVAIGDVVKKRKGNFYTLLHSFWLLKQGHPLIDFEVMKLLFHFLKIKNNPQKHWNDNVG